MSKMYYFDHRIEWKKSIRSIFRENGPCSIYTDGYVFFSQLDPTGYNRNKGPCVIYPNGEIHYQTDRFVMHRTDGPAVIYADGSKIYCIHGKKLTSEEFFLKYGAM